MKVLEFLKRSLIRLEVLVLVLLLFTVTGLSFAQVVLRQFQHGLLWADPLIRHGILWIAFVGGALATARGRHITIDALGRLFHGSSSELLRFLSALLGAWICLQLAQAGFTFLEFEAEGAAIAGIPRAAVVAIIPWGFALIALHFVLELPLALRDAWRAHFNPASGVSQ